MNHKKEVLGSLWVELITAIRIRSNFFDPCSEYTGQISCETFCRCPAYTFLTFRLVFKKEGRMDPDLEFNEGPGEEKKISLTVSR